MFGSVCAQATDVCISCVPPVCHLFWGAGRTNLLIQTIVICGTDVQIAIETVIQTVVIYATDVQTVSILGVSNLEPLNLNSLYVCTINHTGLYNGLYGDMHVCTINHNGLYSLIL